MSASRLDPGDWEIGVSGMTAWINDLEFFEITNDPKSDLLVLTFNHAGIARALLIGKYNWYPDAQAGAQRYLEQ